MTDSTEKRPRGRPAKNLTDPADAAKSAREHLEYATNRAMAAVLDGTVSVAARIRAAARHGLTNGQAESVLGALRGALDSLEDALPTLMAGKREKPKGFKLE